MILPYSSSGTNCMARHPDVQQLKPLNHKALCPNPSQPQSLSCSNSNSPTNAFERSNDLCILDVSQANSDVSSAKRRAYMKEDRLCPYLPLEDDHRSLKRAKLGDAGRREGISGTSNSLSFVEVSPDNVMELIGPKLFCIARRTIVHQQRILAIQVFELHRLIKVQKLIAASPDILFENNFYLTQPSIRSSVKKLLSNNVRESSAVPVKAKVDPTKPITFEHSADNNAPEKLLTLDNENDRRHIPQQPTQNSYVGTPISRSVTSDPKLPLPGNQCLVPIRSPSEGLVYKNYTGPCPPPPGFVASTYGNFTPVNLSAVRGDFSKFQSQTVEDHNTEQRIQVIKVVPHNPKTAPESAARIFRSIQEERKLHFSLTL
ncbi:ELF3-like protein 2 isoform X2 [Nicotiana sylvestris]|nr:PREDICTED: protein EARLY FLOWERING 3-like isoform X2 [Nicotiana sylvestris]XP_016440441.1 PREDICTED: protein EARLY FLOWERING 3-like isoform X2 [Nicotiana tabacum]